MCYTGQCKWENQMGDCKYHGRGTYPCERTEDDVSEREDALYDMYKNGDMSKSQAMAAMQRLRR